MPACSSPTARASSQAALLSDSGRPVDAARYDALLARRAAREPLAYIVGSQEFWSLPFQVSPATLIPRADSEAVVEAALGRPFTWTIPAQCSTWAPARAACCSPCCMSGSGRGVSAWTLPPRPPGSPPGMRGRSASRIVPPSSRRIGTRLFAGRFALVLSNPPYVTLDELPSLQPEVAVWEPRRALDGGADGLAAYRRILARLPCCSHRAGAPCWRWALGRPVRSRLSRGTLACVSRGGRRTSVAQSARFG